MQDDVLKLNLITPEQILSLDPKDVKWLTAEGLDSIARIMGCSWKFNYEMAELGPIPYHAILKSGLHSDFFFNIRQLLEYENIRKIIAWQLVRKFNRFNTLRPQLIAGIPDGATKLAKDLSNIWGVPTADVIKEDNRIIFQSDISSTVDFMPVEDVCTKGTALAQLCGSFLGNTENLLKQIKPFLLTAVNRSGGEHIVVTVNGPEGDIKIDFRIGAIIDAKPNEWNPEDCLLCKKYRSVPLKPKSPAENWKFFQENAVCSI